MHLSITAPSLDPVDGQGVDHGDYSQCGNYGGQVRTGHPPNHFWGISQGEHAPFETNAHHLRKSQINQSYRDQPQPGDVQPPEVSFRHELAIDQRTNSEQRRYEEFPDEIVREFE